MTSSPYLKPQSPLAEPISPASREEIRKYPLSFRGDGAEYFRIWIVNVALTVVTLGFYTPWARVRTRRYFYGNTYLNDRNFNYLANPIALLKGFLIIAIGLIAYNVSGAFLPPLALLIFFIFMGVFPWLIFKSLRFKCHNSAYSNVRLGFKGTCGESYGIYLGLAILVPFTLGLILPYQAYRARQYVFGNLSLGKSRSQTTIEPGRFYLYYLAYLIPFGLIFVIAMIAAMAIPAMMKFQESTEEPPEPLEELVDPDPQARVFPFKMEPAPALLGASEFAPLRRVVLAQLPTETAPDPAGEEVEDYEFDDEFDAETAGFMAGFLAAYFGFLLFLVLVQQFIFVKTTNYTLTNTTIGSCRLFSDMRFRDVLWIFLSNALLIVLTLGIYIPWAMVRFRKYRIEHTAVYAYGDLQEFVAAEEAEQSALGDAAGDYFDFEIGF